ncbi:hypothetical protein [Embleya sp. NPDC020630]
MIVVNPRAPIGRAAHIASSLCDPDGTMHLGHRARRTTIAPATTA